jgi:integrase
VKTASGSVTKKRGRWFARITWTDPTTGKRRERSEYVDTKNIGLDRCKVWREDLANDREPRQFGKKEEKPKIIVASTVADLCDFYRDTYAIDAEYRDGKKIKGQRSWKTTRGHLAWIRDELGDADLAHLSYLDLEEFRAELLDSETRYAEPMSVAYAHRVLSTLRRMLHVARQKKWMRHNPFEEGDPLILLSLERERERIVTPAEEAILLAQCVASKRRTHMRPIIITAIETGMRVREILKLQRKEGVTDDSGHELPWIDWTENVIRVTGFHTKTMRKRAVPITARLREVLREWLRDLPPISDAVFANIGRVQTAWRGITADAGLEDVRFHDLRHTAASRMIASGVELSQVGKILGHAIAQTTWRYLSVDDATARSVAAKMDRKARRVPKKRKEPEVPAEVM